jgi:hypothetical protein
LAERAIEEHKRRRLLVAMEAVIELALETMSGSEVITLLRDHAQHLEDHS